MKNTVSTQVLNRCFGVIQSILAYFSTFLDACFFNCSFKIPIKSIFDNFRFFGSTKIYKLRLVLKTQKLKIDSCVIFHLDSEKFQVFTGKSDKPWYEFDFCVENLKIVNI